MTNGWLRTIELVELRHLNFVGLLLFEASDKANELADSLSFIKVVDGFDVAILHDVVKVVKVSAEFVPCFHALKWNHSCHSVQNPIQWFAHSC